MNVKKNRFTCRTNNLNIYYGVEEFFNDFRSGDLKEDFSLSADAWIELITEINASPEIAEEILGGYIMLLLRIKDKKDLYAISELAEVCIGEQNKENK